MPEGDLEQRVGNAPQAAPKSGNVFDSIGQSIDELVAGVKKIPSMLKNAAYYTYYSIKAGLGLAAGFAMGGPTTLVFPVGMTLGSIGSDLKNKEKITYKKIANELAVGGILSGLLHYLFVGGKYVGDIVKSAYGTTASMVTKGALGLASMPPFLATHEYLNRSMISDYKPKPLTDMGKQLAGPMKWILPPVVANWAVVPLEYQLQVAAGISLAYGMLKSPNKKEEKKEPQQLPQLPPGYAMPRAA